MLKELYDKVNFMLLKLFSYIRSEKGQTVVEYALLLVLIAVVVILMVKGAGLRANNVYSKINSALSTP